MKNTLETRLGLFFALALIVSVLILEMIGAADFLKRGYEITANFKTVQELKTGDQVKLAGVEIGRVEEITLVTNTAVVTMKIQKAYTNIPTDAKAVIKFAGLMGQNFVSIEGGTPGAPKLLAGGTLADGDQPDLAAIMKKLDDLGGELKSAASSFKSENLTTLLGPILDLARNPDIKTTLSNAAVATTVLAQGKGSIGQLLMKDDFYNTALRAVVDVQLASGQLNGMMSDVKGMLGKANGVLDEVKAGKGTLGKLMTDEKLYSETAAAMANMNEILGKINKGQGSVGKLVNDESFLKNAKVSLQKLDKAADSLEDQGPLSVLGIAISTLF